MLGKLRRRGKTPDQTSVLHADEYDLTRGVSLQYLGGDACPHGWGSRSLKLHFQCADGENVLHKEPVVETDTCQYEIFLKSTFGCPTRACGPDWLVCLTRPCVCGSSRVCVAATAVAECFGSNLKLCSSHGVCGYDTDQKAARCFCNPGYAGSFCSDSTLRSSASRWNQRCWALTWSLCFAAAPGDDSGLSAAGAVLIFVSILLVIVLGVLCVAIYAPTIRV